MTSKWKLGALFLALTLIVSSNASAALPASVPVPQIDWNSWAYDTNYVAMKPLCSAYTAPLTCEYSYDGINWTPNNTHVYGYNPGSHYLQMRVCENGSCVSNYNRFPFMVTDGTPINAQAHVKGLGWLPWQSQNAVVGTTGQSRRMEAVRIVINEKDRTLTPAYTNLDMHVLYRVHVKGLGWMNGNWIDDKGVGWFYDGQLAGTTGQSRRMEAIQIKLLGGQAANYTVWYIAHVKGLGWLNWVKNGETAGTTGQSRRMEAMVVEIVPN